MSALLTGHQAAIWQATQHLRSGAPPSAATTASATTTTTTTMNVAHPVTAGPMTATETFEWCSGIYKTEAANILLNVMRQVADTFVRDIYVAAYQQCVTSKLPGAALSSATVTVPASAIWALPPSQLGQIHPLYNEFILAALQSVPTWNQLVLQQEEKQVREQHRQVATLYQKVAAMFVEQLGQATRSHQSTSQLTTAAAAGSSLAMADFGRFLHRFYIALATCDAVCQHTYFQMMGVNKKCFMMEIMRQALYYSLCDVNPTFDNDVPPTTDVPAHIQTTPTAPTAPAAPVTSTSTSTPTRPAPAPARTPTPTPARSRPKPLPAAGSLPPLVPKPLRPAARRPSKPPVADLDLAAPRQPPKARSRPLSLPTPPWVHAAKTVQQPKMPQASSNKTGPALVSQPARTLSKRPSATAPTAPQPARVVRISNQMQTPDRAGSSHLNSAATSPSHTSQQMRSSLDDDLHITWQRQLPPVRPRTNATASARMQSQPDSHLLNSHSQLQRTRRAAAMAPAPPPRPTFYDDDADDPQ